MDSIYHQEYAQYVHLEHQFALLVQLQQLVQLDTLCQEAFVFLVPQMQQVAHQQPMSHKLVNVMLDIMHQVELVLHVQLDLEAVLVQL